MHPQVWVTSGHVGSFSDPLVECQTDHRRFRLDELPGAEDLSATDLQRSRDRRAARAGVPGRRRAAVAAAPVQPDVQDVHGPGRGRRGRRLPPPRDGAGLVRQLQERPAVSRKKLPFGIAQIGKCVPQRDQPGQLRLPDARVRADGDAVLRPARAEAAPPSRSGCPRRCALVRRATASTPARLRLPRARPRRAGALREEGGRRRVPLPVRLEGARGHPQPRRLRPVAPPGESARTSSTSTRRPRSTSSRGSSRRPAGADRSAFTFLIDAYREEEVRGEKRVVLGAPPGARAVQGRGAAAAQEAARDRRALPQAPGGPRNATPWPSTTTRPRSASSTGARTRSARRGASRSTSSRSRTAP